MSGLAGVPIHPGSPPAVTRQLHFLTGVARTWQVDTRSHQIMLCGAPLQVQRAEELCYVIIRMYSERQVMYTGGEDEKLINNRKYMMRDSGAHIEVSE